MLQMESYYHQIILYFYSNVPTVAVSLPAGLPVWTLCPRHVDIRAIVQLGQGHNQRDNHQISLSNFLPSLQYGLKRLNYILLTEPGLEISSSY